MGYTAAVRAAARRPPELRDHSVRRCRAPGRAASGELVLDLLRAARPDGRTANAAEQASQRKGPSSSRRPQRLGSAHRGGGLGHLDLGALAGPHLEALALRAREQLGETSRAKPPRTRYACSRPTATHLRAGIARRVNEAAPRWRQVAPTPTASRAHRRVGTRSCAGTLIPCGADVAARANSVNSGPDAARSMIWRYGRHPRRFSRCAPSCTRRPSISSRAGARNRPRERNSRTSCGHRSRARASMPQSKRSAWPARRDRAGAPPSRRAASRGRRRSRAGANAVTPSSSWPYVGGGASHATAR